jgi:hypothetical protein
MHTKITLLHMIFSAIVLAVVGGRAWIIVRRNGSWRSLVAWGALAILAYFGFIAWISGPGSKFLNQLSEGAFFVIALGLALVVVLGLCEVGFRALDGPFPQLPSDVVAVNIHRRRLYPWMGIAAVTVILMVIVVRIGPASWHDNLFIATIVVGSLSCIALWFLLYKARRFDYGRTALQLAPWFHWEYSADDLKGFKGIKPGADSEAWIGRDGLLFNGDYAPWAMFLYQLVRAEVNNDPPPNLDFTFKQTSFGNATSLEVFHVPIPKEHASDVEMIQQKLRARCPSAEINLLS